ncbi:MAG TPA: hypothetical protein VFV85_07315 [Conexibacter sp.]|nr:hypothetical protein [Conexibacter sp.]
MLRTARALAATLAVLLLPAVAHAATPIQLASGVAFDTAPAVVVGPDGAAHVAWDGTTNHIDYCLLPAGASACTRTRSIDAGSSVGSPNVFLNGSTVEIWAHDQCNGIASIGRWAFTDGGPAPTQTCTTGATGGTHPTAGDGFLLTGSDLFLSGGGAASGQFFHAVSAGAGSDLSADVPVFSSSNYYFESVGEALNGAGTDLGVVGRRLAGDKVTVALYKANATSATKAALNTAGNWAGDIVVPGTADADTNVHMLGHSGSLWALFDADDLDKDWLGLAELHRTPTPGVTEVDRFDGGPSDTEMIDANGTMDASGFQLTWESAGRLRYARTMPNADHTASPITLQGTITTVPDGFGAPDVDTDDTGSGWDVYLTGGSGGTPYRVMAVPLEASHDPADDPPAAGGGGGSGGSGAGGVGGGGAKHAGSGASATHVTTAVVGGGTVLLTTPAACVARGGSFAVKLGSKAPKRRGARFVKVTRVAFGLSGRRGAKVDPRAPFKQSFKLKASARRGSKLTLTATATIRLTHRATTHKTIAAKVKVCG